MNGWIVGGGVMKRFVINRATWARGHRGGEVNTLLNTNGYQCCLGFYLSACGVADADLASQGDPADVDCLGKVPEAQWLLRTVEDVGRVFTHNSAATQELIEANDGHLYDGYTAVDREKRVVALFARQGIEVVFEGP